MHKLEGEDNLLKKPSREIFGKADPHQAVFDKVIAQVATSYVFHHDGEVAWSGEDLLKLCDPNVVIGQTAGGEAIAFRHHTVTKAIVPARRADEWISTGG